MSAKRLSPKDLLAERNPLNRQVVAPVDIYDQIETASQQAKKEVQSAPKTSQKSAKKPTNTAKKIDKADDPVNPYSTYLRKSQVKQIKHRAVDLDVKDQHIVQAAIDEYFARHKEVE